MRYLIAETVAAKPHLETAGELALRLRNEGHDVVFAWLGDDLPWSDWDLPWTLRLMGGSQVRRERRFEYLLRAEDIQIAAPVEVDPERIKLVRTWAHDFDGDLEDLKAIKLEAAELGMGVASSLISWRRDSRYDPRTDPGKTRACLESAGIVYERAKVLIAREKPDTVITFNGRFATSRPIVAASGLAGVPLLRHERGSTFERYELFTDAIHNYAYIRERIAERWRQADTASRETQGHEFYRRRRGGDGIGWRSYTSSQDRGRVPPLIPGKRRLVYFTSSDDEYAAVTDAYVPGHWPDQFSAVGALMRASSRQPDIELVIRVHPHLEIKSVAERARWNAVAKNGATIIAADDPVDTYALVDSADIVASYGSTIGMEAVYWGKPVILVGPCSYAGSPAVHEPRDEAALESLLSPGRQLPRPDSALCLPYGYYYLTYGTPYQYYSPESLFEGKFLGHRLEWDNPLIRSLRSVGVGRLYQRLMQAWR